MQHNILYSWISPWIRIFAHTTYQSHGKNQEMFRIAQQWSWIMALEERQKRTLWDRRAVLCVHISSFLRPFQWKKRSTSSWFCWRMFTTLLRLLHCSWKSLSSAQTLCLTPVGMSTYQVLDILIPGIPTWTANGFDCIDTKSRKSKVSIQMWILGWLPSLISSNSCRATYARGPMYILLVRIQKLWNRFKLRLYNGDKLRKSIFCRTLDRIIELRSD